jgi:trans-aconitate 2-methyltransferase
MSPWNPDLYLKFIEERTQPVYDLVDRIAVDDPKTIADLGCGPGNSTRVLRERWPEADIIGVDNSVEMIRKACASFPKEKWLLSDIQRWQPEEKFDVIFSGATLQWLPDHARLMPGLFSRIASGGALAVQLPANQESPLHRALIRVSASEEWKTITAPCADLIVYNGPEYYYDLFSALAPQFALWETTYFHVLESHQALIDWYSATGMRTYLERLPDEARKESFCRQVLAEAREAYPIQRNGKILYPFKRLFFIAYRPE